MTSPVLDLLYPLLRVERNGDMNDGGLTILEDACDKLMDEIKLTAKEVGGTPTRSMRYLEAQEIKSFIKQMRQIAAHKFTFNVPAENGNHG
jgi:hypothetical protein